MTEIKLNRYEIGLEIDKSKIINHIYINGGWVKYQDIINLLLKIEKSFGVKFINFEKGETICRLP